MLFRRLCFSVSKSIQNPFSIPLILTNPSFNSQYNLTSASNFKTLKLGLQRTISGTPHVNSTMDSPRRPLISPIPPLENATQLEIIRAIEFSLSSKFSSESIIPNPNPLIIVISGPSGVGKDAVIKRLREVREDLHFVVTATSRAKRPGEIDGVDYFFYTKDEFLSLIAKNELLEYALVYGEYKGIPKQQIKEYMNKGCDIVLRVDIQGARTLRGILKNNAIFVFLVAESEEALVKRLIGRKTESTEDLIVRVASAKEELRHLKEFDYVVVNEEGELERSVGLVESIIDAEKSKVQQRKAVV